MSKAVVEYTNIGVLARTAGVCPDWLRRQFDAGRVKAEVVRIGTMRAVPTEDVSQLVEKIRERWSARQLLRGEK